MSRLSEVIVRRGWALALLLAGGLAGCQSEGGSSGPPSPTPGGSGGRTGRGGSPGTGGGDVTGAGGGGGAPVGPDAAGDGGTSSSEAAVMEVAPAPCPASQLVCDPSGKPPRSIKDTGLFPSAPDFTRVSERLVGYAPSPELWSDGLKKQRYLLLPPGGKVDNKNPARWEYPLGAIAVKTFLHDTPAGPRPVETRLIRKVADPVEPFEFHVYRWNAEGTDADLVDITNPVPVPVTVAGRRFMHDIPSKTHCGDCHTANAQVASTIIGLSELHLTGKLTPTDADSQLTALARRGLFTSAVSPSPPTIVDPNPVLQRVKRFMVGNCVHCHNGQGANPVDLRPEVFVRNTIGKSPEGPGVEPIPGWYRIRPRMPERSVVYLQTLGGNLPATLRIMPPVGVQVRDLPEFSAELENLKAWINSLPLN